MRLSSTPSLASFSSLAGLVLIALPLVGGSSVAYTSPASDGGSQLDSSAGLGEPLNVIISGLSTSSVLSSDGILNWARSIEFSTECGGLHIGNPQTANLGDGAGWVNETAVLRYDYGNSANGTCDESIVGGNHFRYWQQTTTNAFFLAASVELNFTTGHDIAVNGYDLGRDYIVGNATSGTTSFGGVSYKTTNSYVTGLLQPGTNGINHGISIDGRVALLTITASAAPASPTSGTSAGSPSGTGAAVSPTHSSGTSRTTQRWWSITNLIWISPIWFALS